MRAIEKQNYIKRFLQSVWICLKKYISLISYIRYYIFRPKLKNSNKKTGITVSFTTYPNRVKWLPIIVGSIVRQTMQPDRIVLYLSSEEFHDIDDKVFRQIRYQGVQIELREGNLRSHKKYIYAMKDFPDDVVITVDDDIIYDKNLIKDLYNSYLKHPKAVSAKRVHQMIFNKSGDVVPYDRWLIATKNLIDIESYNLVATGCGGILYPPHSLDERVFDSSVIKKTCLKADDLWLKIMELLKGTTVVLVKSNHYKLNHIWNTEREGLALDNVGTGENDKQLRYICHYFSLDLNQLVYQNGQQGKD